MSRTSTPDIALDERGRRIKCLIERVGGVLLRKSHGWEVIFPRPGVRRRVLCRDLDEVENVALSAVWSRLDTDGHLQ